jgi:hypothetical protein
MSGKHHHPNVHAPALPRPPGALDEDDAEMRAAVLIADPAHRQAATAAVLARAKVGARAAGVAAERARGAAIFAHPNAARNPDFAARLACSTSMPTDEALALMETVPAASGLSARMAGQKRPMPGAPGGSRDPCVRSEPGGSK